MQKFVDIHYTLWYNRKCKSRSYFSIANKLNIRNINSYIKLLVCFLCLKRKKYFLSILHPHLIPIKLLKILHFRQFRSAKFSSLHITDVVMTSECLILQGFREFNSAKIVQFFSLHITPIKSNAKTLEKPKKIKDSESLIR